jgi:hypothetical protein
MVCIAGCGSSTMPASEPGGGATSGAAGLSILVTSAELVQAIGVLTPAAGRRFARIELQLSNVGEETLSVAYPLFSVRTAGGLQISASVASRALPRPCAEDQSLAPGGASSCQLAFEVPSSEEPRTLHYAETPHSRSSTANLPVPVELTLHQGCERHLPALIGERNACRDCVVSGANGVCRDPACWDRSCACYLEPPASRCDCFVGCVKTETCEKDYLKFYECVRTLCAIPCDST